MKQKIWLLTTQYQYLLFTFPALQCTTATFLESAASQSAMSLHSGSMSIRGGGLWSANGKFLTRLWNLVTSYDLFLSEHLECKRVIFVTIKMTGDYLFFFFSFIALVEIAGTNLTCLCCYHPISYNYSLNSVITTEHNISSSLYHS